MEHYTSTLATTAVAVFGLVAAAHILHPGNYEMQPRPARPPVAVSSAATAWVDPPKEMRITAAPVVRVSDASGPAGALGAPSLLSPRMVAVLAPGAIMAPTLSSTMAQPPVRVQKAAAVQRRKIVQRARTRQASLDRGSVAAAAPEAHAVAPARSGIDPIGDLMRGLGLGGEG